MERQMGVSERAARRGPARGRSFLFLAFALFVAPGLSGCGAEADHAATWTAQPGRTAATSGAVAMTDVMQAAWKVRPAYVRNDARTEEAYAFAMTSAAVLRWIPCYCGCGAMGHRSNLDCFFKPTMAGLSELTFEEHASYCDICVDTALMAKRMAAEGQSLRAIRAAIDATFGGGAPGTVTELPPA
jgi:hypothetical protein